MSSLYEWFKSRNEESAINKTLVHMKKVLETVVEFEKGLSFFIEEKNTNLAIKVFSRVGILEHQADAIRRNILNMISKAELPSKIRENLMHLVERIDDIANAANASARIFIYMNHADFFSLYKDVHENILKMARISVEAVKKVNFMVNSLLSVEKSEIHDIGEEVNLLEHKCDELQFKINRILVSDHPNINPFSAIEIYNCISIIEAITDNAEDVADYIIMLMASKKS